MTHRNPIISFVFILESILQLDHQWILAGYHCEVMNELLIYFQQKNRRAECALIGPRMYGKR